MRIRMVCAIPLLVGLVATPVFASGHEDNRAAAAKRGLAPGQTGFSKAAGNSAAEQHALADTLRASMAGRSAASRVRLVDGHLLVADTTRGPRDRSSSIVANAVTTTPVITEPSDGAQVSGVVTAGADSSAAVVRFTMPSVRFQADVPVDAGHASAAVETWGADGADTIYAADCDGAGECGDPVGVNVDVANAAPTLTTPAAGATVATSFQAAATAPGGLVAFRIDGNIVDTDATAPYEKRLYTDGLAAGPHQVSAVLCNLAGTTCATSNPSANVRINIKRNLKPQLVKITPSPFSPGHDGRKDTTVVTYRLDSAQRVAWRVTNGAGRTVAGPTSLGTRGAGTHTFTYTGKTKSGGYLSTGRYVMHLDTKKPITNDTLRGHSQLAFRVDRNGPRISSVRPSAPTVFPVKDRYRDSVVLRGRLNERVTWLTADIRNAAGQQVRTLRVGGRAPGQVGITWNGRRSNGTQVPAGHYTFRFTAQDMTGNRSTSRPRGINVSDKHLVRRQGSRTVTARGSVVKPLIGICSEVFSPGVRGWAGSLGYYSDYDGCSVSSGDDLASVIHGVTLPKAIRYGSARVSAYGGKALNNFNDRAALLYFNRHGTLTNTGRVLKPAIGNHSAQAVGANFITPNGRLRWLVGTINGNYYDVKSYTIHYSYFILQ